MSIASVRLPERSDSDYDTSSELEPPQLPPKPKIPKKTELAVSKDEKDNPFEVRDDDDVEVTAPDGSISYEALGLPALTFNTDPFLSPIKSVQFAVKRHRIWIKGIKGVKFSLSISGYTVLVAKRKMKYMKKTWFISRSMDFSLDTQDLAGILIKQRRGKSFSLFGPHERQGDHCRPGLAAISFEDEHRTVVLGNNLWLPPEKDDIFEEELTQENSIKMKSVPYQFDVKSIKNGAFCIESSEPCLVVSKQVDRSAVVSAKGPLSIVQAFGLTIALFMQ
jgi:hypothetical protein